VPAAAGSRRCRGSPARARAASLSSTGATAAPDSERSALRASRPSDFVRGAVDLALTIRALAIPRLTGRAASGVAGLLWTTIGPSWAFAYLTGWMAVAAAILTRTPPRPTPLFGLEGTGQPIDDRFAT
jgi:hypothetical protein